MQDQVFWLPGLPWPRLPIQINTNSGFAALSPVTAAGPPPIFTGFPDFLPNQTNFMKHAIDCWARQGLVSNNMYCGRL